MVYHLSRCTLHLESGTTTREMSTVNNPLVLMWKDEAHLAVSWRRAIYR
jgi:hypothetical protein